MSQGLDGGLDPGHVAVMIGTPYIDKAIVTSKKLVLVIRDIGCEIGELACGSPDHAVLLVFILFHHEMNRTLFPLEPAFEREHLEAGADGAGFMELLLGEVVVVDDSEPAKIFFNPCQDLSACVFRAGLRSAGAVLGKDSHAEAGPNQSISQIPDVVSLVIVCGELGLRLEKLLHFCAHEAGLGGFRPAS